MAEAKFVVAGCPLHKVVYDVVDGVTSYIGFAAPGSLESSPAWLVQKITYSGNGSFTTTFADGKAKFVNVWDNRKSLSYS